MGRSARRNCRGRRQAAAYATGQMMKLPSVNLHVIELDPGVCSATAIIEAKNGILEALIKVLRAEHCSVEARLLAADLLEGKVKRRRGNPPSSVIQQAMQLVMPAMRVVEL